MWETDDSKHLVVASVSDCIPYCADQSQEREMRLLTAVDCADKPLKYTSELEFCSNHYIDKEQQQRIKQKMFKTLSNCI